MGLACNKESAAMIPQPQKKRNKQDLSSDFIELTPSATYGDTLAVGGKHQQTAKFWDCHSHFWRHTRLEVDAGFFVPVYFTPGYVSGSWGIRCASRNNHVAFQKGDDRTGQFLPTVKTISGAEAMNAISHPVGNPARSASAQPDLDKITSTLLKASSIVTLMGWAAIGQEYANPNPKDAPSGFDYANAAQVVSDMLSDVCGTLETVKFQQGGE